MKTRRGEQERNEMESGEETRITEKRGGNKERR